jgi:hypothetical protein
LSKHPILFLADVKTRVDIKVKYAMYRSFRRGSDSWALVMNVSETDIDVVNRWTKKETAGTSRPGHEMRHIMQTSLLCCLTSGSTPSDYVKNPHAKPSEESKESAMVFGLGDGFLDFKDHLIGGRTKIVWQRLQPEA